MQSQVSIKSALALAKLNLFEAGCVWRGPGYGTGEDPGLAGSGARGERLFL